MRIVAAVAIDTLVAQLGRIARPGMASRADQPLVLAGQSEAGLAIVIEPPDFPVGRVVAVLALGRRAQRPGMPRVGVTGSAGRAFGGKALVGVA